MSEELTVWFPAEIKPARKGVYETQFRNGQRLPLQGYSHWNGRFWGDTSQDIKNALARRHIEGHPKKSWRGLAKPARATGKGE